MSPDTPVPQRGQNAQPKRDKDGQGFQLMGILMHIGNYWKSNDKDQHGNAKHGDIFDAPMPSTLLSHDRYPLRSPAHLHAASPARASIA
jgi:hypothetical protein